MTSLAARHKFNKTVHKIKVLHLESTKITERYTYIRNPFFFIIKQPFIWILETQLSQDETLLGPVGPWNCFKYQWCCRMVTFAVVITFRLQSRFSGSWPNDVSGVSAASLRGYRLISAMQRRLCNPFLIRPHWFPNTWHGLYWAQYGTSVCISEVALRALPEGPDRIYHTGDRVTQVWIYPEDNCILFK